MPIVPASSFAPSKKPYAIDLNSFQATNKSYARSDGTTYPYTTASIDAVWVGRKNGLTYVTSGHLSTGGSGCATLREFLDNFDPRYGGQAEARWDGTSMWAPEMAWVDTVAEQARLDIILKNLDAVPPGFDGWYQLSR
jgi:hypothetical protein